MNNLNRVVARKKTKKGQSIMSGANPDPANPTPTPDPANPDPAKPAAPAQPAKPGPEPAKPSSGAFDPSSIKDEDFEKLFSDDRLYKHPRFKSLSERAKKADDLEKAQSEAEKKALEEQGKWKELAEKREQEANAAKQQAKDLALKNTIQAEAAKLGIVDVEAAAVLIDKTGVTVADDGTVTGAAEALTKLLEAKPYLKGTPQQQPVGSPSNPNPTQTEGGAKSFKLSQIQDHEFYKKNEKEIAEAFKLGLVEDDVYGSGAGASATPTPQAT